MPQVKPPQQGQSHAQSSSESGNQAAEAAAGSPEGQSHDSKDHGPGGTSFYRLNAKDTAGNRQELFAAYRNGQFVLFQIEHGGTDSAEAQVMYLLPAASAADIARVVSGRIIDVEDAAPLAAPPLSAAKLLPSHPFTAIDRGVVGVILGLPLSALR